VSSLQNRHVFKLCSRKKFCHDVWMDYGCVCVCIYIPPVYIGFHIQLPGVHQSFLFLELTLFLSLTAVSLVL
jgi:hypothetical protein